MSVFYLCDKSFFEHEYIYIRICIYTSELGSKKNLKKKIL